MSAEMPMPSTEEAWVCPQCEHSAREHYPHHGRMPSTTACVTCLDAQIVTPNSWGTEGICCYCYPPLDSDGRATRDGADRG